MPNKCQVLGCRSNHAGTTEYVSVFEFPSEKDEKDLRNQWIKFVNRGENWVPPQTAFICMKHFEKKYLMTGKVAKRFRLNRALKPLPTIFVPESNNVVSSSDPTATVPPTLLDPDVFRLQDVITSLDDVTDSLSPPGYTFRKYDNHVIYYQLEVSEETSVPEVTGCIRVDSDLHVKLFFKGSPLPLPEWFRYGRDCTMNRKSMLENFPAYIKMEEEKLTNIFDELRQLRHQKAPIYSANVIRYCLFLRYTSLQAYLILMKDFPLPSLSLLRKLCKGGIDALKCAVALKASGKISDDVVLMFDEMFLQKCEEYVGGETYGVNEEGDLYKGLVSFMIAGLKENVPYVIKSNPEIKISGEWLKTQLIDCLNNLISCGFNVRCIVSDNHSSNVSAYNHLINLYGEDRDSLFITYDSRKIYLFFDSVHLMKNIRNNLLDRKRFLFPPFSFGGLKDPISLQGGEINWRTLYDVGKKDADLDAHLKKAPKINSKVLNPANCNQNVSVALAIFHETTSAAIEQYFPDRKGEADFLRLMNTWWIISNAKRRFSTHILGHGVTDGDGKVEFLSEMANWVDLWHNQRIPNCEQFGLTAQTASALIRTLRCHALLIQDLLSEGYRFVLTARFQSDPLERRFGQYRQMSGGRFLVGLKDVVHSEKILKIKSLLKESIDIDENVKECNQNESVKIKDLLLKIDDLNLTPDRIRLDQGTREVAVHVAGYAAKEFLTSHECCKSDITSDNSETNPDHAYINILNRGGLTIPSPNLTDYVCTSFAILSLTENLILNSGIKARNAALKVLTHVHGSTNQYFTCSEHILGGQTYMNRTIANVFFNNKRKATTSDVKKDEVIGFKRQKRLK